MTLSSMKGQIKKIDEYEYVGRILKVMYTQNAENTKALVGTLNMVQQSYLKGILQSKRVAVQRKGERTTVARRILKPKQGKSGPATAPTATPAESSSSEMH